MTSTAKSTASLEFVSHSHEQTATVAAALAGHLLPGDVVTLAGELGAGKTCFVRGMAAGLGIETDLVTSPTFVICQEYAGSRKGGSGGVGGGGGVTLAHIDAYRLSGPGELESIGWQELLAAKDVIIAIEWPSRIEAALPANRIQIELSHEGTVTRRIRITASAELIKKLGPIVAAIPVPMRNCRTCGKPIAETAPTFPFCSDRCRLADLGQWFNEGFRMTRPVEEDDELED